MAMGISAKILPNEAYAIQFICPLSNSTEFGRFSV